MASAETVPNKVFSTRPRTAGANDDQATMQQALFMKQHSRPTKPRIAVIGTGAIGGYYGGNLAKHYDVHFFARSDVQHLREHGLRIDSVQGNFLINPVSTGPLNEAVAAFDLVMVSVKTTQTAAVVEQLAPLLHPATVLLIIQNGLNVEAVFHDRYPSTTLVGGLAFICATKRGPGWIEHQDYGAVKLGNFHQANDATLNWLGSLFQTAGITCTVTTDLHTARWEKLVWNIPFAGLCIQNDCETQALLTDPQHRAHLKLLMTEVIHIARACGCLLADNLADKMLANTDAMVNYAPSTLLDFRARKPIELEAIFQQPWRAALAKGVHTPYLNKLVASLAGLVVSPSLNT